MVAANKCDTGKHNVAIKKSYAPNLIQAREWLTAFLSSVGGHAKCKLCRTKIVALTRLVATKIEPHLMAGGIYSPENRYEKPGNYRFFGLQNQNLISNRDRDYVSLRMALH